MGHLGIDGATSFTHTCCAMQPFLRLPGAGDSFRVSPFNSARVYAHVRTGPWGQGRGTQGAGVTGGCDSTDPALPKRPGPNQALVGRPGEPELLFMLGSREHSSLHGGRGFSNPGVLQASWAGDACRGKSAGAAGCAGAVRAEEGSQVQLSVCSCTEGAAKYHPS
ncbi:hypothetical protein NN561_008439 [Cricetulus griseus]